MTRLAKQARPQDRLPLDYERYAITIFDWCRAYPDSTRAEFLEMLVRVDAQVAAIMAWRS